jgi:hypothetical protein
MKPRDVLCTTAAILVFGLAPLAGSQPDQKDHGKKSDQGQQQGQQQAQRQPPGQAKKQQPPARGRQQQPVRGRRQDPGPPVRQRQATDPGRFQRPADRTPQYRPPTPQQQQRPVERVCNRQMQPPRQVSPAPVQSRTSVTRGVQQQTVWPRYRARSWTSQHRTWVQRGGYRGYRVPQSRFVLYFGRPHRFHLSSYTVRIVGAYPEFYADGYWFTLLDPVPEYWDDDWYDVDYCTIVELDDGYYLVNDSYPDVLLAVSVQL